MSGIQPSDGEAVMPVPQKWVVCEQSGRWSAALRVAAARWLKGGPTLRLHEVRTLGELSSHLEEHGSDLALVEVGRENLTDVVQLLMRRGPRLSQFVALLDEASPSRQAAAGISEPDTQPLADWLWELGALEVVESPRQLRGLLALHHRLAAARGPSMNGAAARESFAEWAWSTVPWQDR